MRWHGLKTEVTSCVFEYSRSDLMGILNYFKDAVIGYRLFWISMKLSHEVTSWVFWMFKSWRHGCFEWVFWIFMLWRHGYCEYSWSDLMGILNIQRLTSLVFWNSYSKMTRLIWNIQNTHDVTSSIFKMTNVTMNIQNYTKIPSFEYSKYPWHHFKNIPKYPWRQLLNTPMTSLCEYSKYQWRHFVNIQNASFEYSKAVAMVILKIHEVM